MGLKFDFAEVSFRVRYGAPKVRSLRKFRVNLYRGTPRKSRQVLDLAYSEPQSSKAVPLVGRPSRRSLLTNTGGAIMAAAKQRIVGVQCTGI